MGSQCLPPQHAQRRCMLGTPVPHWATLCRPWRDLGKMPQGPRRVENARLPPGRRRYKMSRLKPRPTKQAQGCRPDPSVVRLGELPRDDSSSGSESLVCRPKGRRYKVGVKSRRGCDANDALATRDHGEYAHAERAAPIKKPDGFDRNVAFCVAGHCGYSSPARGCDAPGSRKSTTKEAILDGRKKHHGDESHLGPHRADDERHGAHRTRGLPLADVLDPGDDGGDCTRDVAGDLCRFTPLFCNGRWLL